MTSPFLGEFLGTMTLIMLGDGVVAGALLKQSKGENAGWIAITAGWAFAVLAGVFVATRHRQPRRPPQPGRYRGGRGQLRRFQQARRSTSRPRCSAPSWAPCSSGSTTCRTGRATQDAGLKLACFCTGPAIRDAKANWISEIIATFFLILTISALVTNTLGATGAIPRGVAPYMVGMLVWGIGLSLGGTTGYAINPARDLGPRIAHAVLPIAGKGTSDWGYALIPVAAPLVGAALAGLFVRALGI